MRLPQSDSEAERGGFYPHLHSQGRLYSRLEIDVKRRSWTTVEFIVHEYCRVLWQSIWEEVMGSKIFQPWESFLSCDGDSVTVDDGAFRLSHEDLRTLYALSRPDLDIGDILVMGFEVEEDHSGITFRVSLPDGSGETSLFVWASEFTSKDNAIDGYGPISRLYGNADEGNEATVDLSDSSVVGLIEWAVLGRPMPVTDDLDHSVIEESRHALSAYRRGRIGMAGRVNRPLYWRWNREDGTVTPRDEWDEQDSDGRLACTQVGGILVSTVFLGMDFQCNPSGPPLLWETMIFGGEEDLAGRRCSTESEAREQHDRIVASVRASAEPETEQA